MLQNQACISFIKPEFIKCRNASLYTEQINRSWLINHCVGLLAKVLIAEGLQECFCEKLLETSSMSDRAKGRQLQDRQISDGVMPVW